MSLSCLTPFVCVKSREPLEPETLNFKKFFRFGFFVKIHLLESSKLEMYD